MKFHKLVYNMDSVEFRTNLRKQSLDVYKDKFLCRKSFLIRIYFPMKTLFFIFVTVPHT